MVLFTFLISHFLLYSHSSVLTHYFHFLPLVILFPASYPLLLHSALPSLHFQFPFPFLPRSASLVLLSLFHITFFVCSSVPISSFAFFLISCSVPRSYFHFVSHRSIFGFLIALLTQFQIHSILISYLFSFISNFPLFSVFLSLYFLRFFRLFPNPPCSLHSFPPLTPF